MDETKFKNHAEKEFWQAAYLAYLAGAGSPVNAAVTADSAISNRRIRMQGLAKPGVRAA
jgi:hypothetical protein